MYRFQLKHTLFICLLAGHASIGSTVPDFTNPVTMEAAVGWAIESSPAMERLEAEAEVAEGLVEQAMVRPNPVVGAEIENFLGSGSLRGVDALEITVGLTQVFETADKRSKRVQLAKQEGALLQWERDAILAGIEARVRELFITALLAQETVALRREQFDLATQNLQETQRLAEATRAPLVDVTRAKLSMQQAQLALGNAERAQTGSLDSLMATWGLSGAQGLKLAGRVNLEPVPEFQTILTEVHKTTTMAQFGALKRQRQAALDLEQAQATPDFEIFGGARYFNDDGGDAAFVLGVEVPWPVFDKNQGNIRSARARLRAIDSEKDEAYQELFLQLTSAHRDLLNAFEEAEFLENKLLPIARQTLQETRAAYNKGQFTLLAVLDSREALSDIREAYLDALSRYAQAQARIATLLRPAQHQQ